MSMAGTATLPGHARVGKSGRALVTGFVQVLALLAISIDGLFIEAGSVHINSERIILAPVLVLLPYLAMTSGQLQVTNTTKFYFLFAFAVLFSTLYSWAPSKHVNGLIITVIPFFYFLLFSERSFAFAGMGRLIESWLWFMGVGCVMSYGIWLATNQLDFMINLGRIRFLMFEPNILGAALASMMLAHLAFFKPILRHFVLHAIGVLALLFTASRAPYVAYAISFIYYLFRSGLIRRPIVAFGIIMAFLLAIIAGVFLLERITEAYSNNLDRVDSIDTRFTTLGLAWEHFLEHPILGNGPLDFSLRGTAVLAQIGSTDIRDAWIAQIWIAVLHDEGLIGFAFFIGFIIASWRRTEKMMAAGHHYFLAYQTSVLALLISSQATTSHLTAVFGMFFGLANSPPLARSAKSAVRHAATRMGHGFAVGPVLRRGTAVASQASNTGGRAAPPRMPIA